MKKSARLYQCNRCHSQVIICSHCDRGNVYCSADCSSNARAQSQHRANQKYQSSRKGRLANTERQRRYRMSQREKVTYQGSLLGKADDLLLPPPKTSENAFLAPSNPENRFTHCHFCHSECSLFLRTRFIRRR